MVNINRTQPPQDDPSTHIYKLALTGKQIASVVHCLKQMEEANRRVLGTSHMIGPIKKQRREEIEVYEDARHTIIDQQKLSL